MDQNAFGQSDYKIFKSTISLEKNDETAWFFTCWYRFMEIRIWLKNIGVGMVKNGCSHSVLKTLKMSRKNEWNKLIFGVLIQIQETESYFNIFLVVVVKNVRGLLGLGTLISAVSQELIDEMSWFFAYWYKFRKAKSYFDNY